MDARQGDLSFGSALRPKYTCGQLFVKDQDICASTIFFFSRVSRGPNKHPDIFGWFREKHLENLC